MKLSKQIEQLQALLAKHGDVPFVVFNRIADCHEAPLTEVKKVPYWNEHGRYEDDVTVVVVR